MGRKSKAQKDQEAADSEKATTSVGGSPEELAGKIDSSTPIVTDKPETPQDRIGGDEGKKRTRRTKKVVEAEAEQRKLDEMKIMATTVVDLKLAMLERLGGEIFKAAKEERAVQISVYTKMLYRLPEIPWYVELAVVEGVFFAPRVVQLQMLAKERKAAEEAQSTETPRAKQSPATGQLTPRMNTTS